MIIYKETKLQKGMLLVIKINVVPLIEVLPIRVVSIITCFISY